MHKSNFVTAIKVGGKVLREFDNSVYIPFGSEYTILLKNLSSVRARVSVSIDGKDALDGMRLVVNPKSSIDLKRFIKNGNMDAGNAFKFIEKTAKVEKHRGNRAEDGLITINYEFESDWKFYSGGGLAIAGGAKSRGYDTFVQKIGDNSYNPHMQTEDFYFTSNADTAKGSYVESLPEPNGVQYSTTANYCAVVGDDVPRSKSVLRSALPQNTAGITAPGTVTEQKFVPASLFMTDGIVHTMTIELKGGVGPQNNPVKAPVTVTRLTRCSMCGTNVRQTAKFCHECGSSVEII